MSQNGQNPSAAGGCGVAAGLAPASLGSVCGGGEGGRGGGGRSSSVAVLSSRLKLATLPRESLPYCVHAVMKNLLFTTRRDAFFSYTENALEVSIVADVETVDADFPKPAGREEEALQERRHASYVCPGLQISPDVFCALQIDNEPHLGIDNAGKRINELSGPLANAGISIFYMSTYQTDYVLVKEHQMPLVISTLRTENFSCVDADDEFTEHFGPAGRLDDQLDRNGKSSLRPPFKLQPRRSPSPGSQLLDPFSICEIRRLCRKVVTNHSLRMVGLNRDFFERWGLKLLKILFYPELLDGSTSEIPYSTVSDDSPVDEWRERRLDVSPVGARFCSYTATEEGISLIADENLLEEFTDHELNRSSLPCPLRCIQMDLSDFGLDRFGVVYSVSEPLVRAGDINLLYLSTFKTANVLVNEGDLDLAMKILLNAETADSCSEIVEDKNVPMPAAHFAGSLAPPGPSEPRHVAGT